MLLLHSGDSPSQSTFVIKPLGRSSNQPACKDKSLDVVFEVIVNYYADLYICFRKAYDPSEHQSRFCSHCPYEWNRECSKLLDRENWTISARVGKCGLNRTINVHIPSVTDMDNGTIFLSYEINSGDRDELAHINVLADVCRSNSYVLILEILLPLAVVVLIVIIIIIIILIRCGAVRKGRRGRYLNDILQEEEPVVVPVMCGRNQPQLQGLKIHNQ